MSASLASVSEITCETEQSSTSAQDADSLCTAFGSADSTVYEAAALTDHMPGGKQLDALGQETERPTIMSRLGTFYRQVPTGLTDDQVMREIAFKILLGPMALRKAEPTVIVHRRRVPDFTGVPGQLASSDEIAGLEFGAKLRKSPYDALLDQLAIAPKGSALKFGDLKCRPSIYSRARKKGLRISFAERGGALFVRFDGRDDDDVRATTRRAAILAALKLGPMSHVKITNKLRDAGDSVLDAAATDAILHQMFKVGQVLRQEGGNWALNPKAAVS